MNSQRSTFQTEPWSVETPVRVMTYSHDSCGLGHLRRSMTIAEAITCREPSAQVLCVSGSPVPETFPLPPRTELLKLPSISKDPSGQYRSRHLPLSFREVAQLRGDLIAAAVRAFRPQLLIVDHTASGPGQELLPALESLRREFPTTRIALGLRDILDTPERAREELSRHRTFDCIRRLYDMVLVYGQRELFDVAVEYRMPTDIAARIQYVGVVVPEGAQTPRRTMPPRRCPHYLVTAGGGEDGGDVLLRAAAAVRGPLKQQRLRATFVTGPLAPESVRQQLLALVDEDPRCTVLRTAHDMQQLVADADVVIGMGGYNTVYEALARGVPVVAVPRTGPRLEQHERCRRLEAMGLLRTVDTAAASDPNQLAETIASAASSRTLLRPIAFDGARRAAELCLLSLRRSRTAIAL